VFPVRRGRCQGAPRVGRGHGGSSTGHRGHSEAAASARGADRHLRVLGLILCDYDTIVQFFGSLNQNGRTCHPHRGCGQNELGSILHWIIHSILKFIVEVIQNLNFVHLPASKYKNLNITFFGQDRLPSSNTRVTERPARFSVPLHIVRNLVGISCLFWHDNGY